MATTDEKTLNAGLWEVALGDMLIPAEFLGDIKTKIAMKTVEKDTQAGTSKRRTNVVDTAEATFTLGFLG